MHVRIFESRCQVEGAGFESVYKGDATCTEVIPPALTVVPLRVLGYRGAILGYIGGFYADNGKENGNYYF